jgi:DNA-binding response OmpR family regulator
MLNLLKQRFEKEGYSVKTATTAEDANGVLLKSAIDLICLDILLPGENGFTFLKAVKEDTQLKSIPVFILSNLGQQEEIQHGLSLGAEDFLIKANVAPRDIVARIDTFFNR